VIYFVTNNAGKFEEISALIPGLEQLRLDLDEIQSLDPQRVIEYKLAQAAQQREGDEFIVEDTSLSLACLHGLPGTFVKWFEQTLGVNGIAGLAMKHEDRSALALVTIGYRNADGDVRYFSGRLEGTIVPPRGSNGFGWDTIFEPKGADRTMAQMTTAEKNRISMRQAAARKLAAHLQPST
jgi:inosine triphosphate pyrophosphatase